VAPPAHVGDTEKNRPYDRVEEWKQYTRTGRFAGRADWVLLDRLRVGQLTCTPSRYVDARYRLCRR
jgi:hypothetical protein